MEIRANFMNNYNEFKEIFIYYLLHLLSKLFLRVSLFGNTCITDMRAFLLFTFKKEDSIKYYTSALMSASSK